MESTEVLIQAVEGFQDQEDGWNDTLEKFIAHIAETGDTLVAWDKVRKIFMRKLQLVLEEFYRVCPYSPGKINPNATNDDFDEMKQRLLQLTEEFDEPPFTIQRLCELLVEPMKNYKKCEKFMRGLEKNLMVVTSWSHPTRRASQGNDSMVNGISLGPSNCIPPNERVKPHWANLPPSPIATAPPKIPGAPDFTATTTTKDSAPVEDSSENTQGDGDKASTTPQEDTKDNSSDDRKPNVSATIISSSPTITINIKRKIEESLEDDSQKSSNQLVPESPTKKLKFDDMEDCQEPDSTESTSEETPVDSAKTDDSLPEKVADESSENVSTDEIKDDPVQPEQTSDPQSTEGAPVDPAAEDSNMMEVD